MRAACAQEFEAHWQCLELNNQASLLGAHTPLTNTEAITETICVQEARAAAQRMHVYQAGPFLRAISTLWH